jgi:hypothetical protein
MPKKYYYISNINADDLKLWKVNISSDNEEKFSQLVLKIDEKEDIKLIYHRFAIFDCP